MLTPFCLLPHCTLTGLHLQDYRPLGHMPQEAQDTKSLSESGWDEGGTVKGTRRPQLLVHEESKDQVMGLCQFHEVGESSQGKARLFFLQAQAITLWFLV